MKDRTEQTVFTYDIRYMLLNRCLPTDPVYPNKHIEEKQKKSS